MLKITTPKSAKRSRRRKMQRFLEKNPAMLEELTKQMLLNGWRPDDYEQSVEPSVE